MKQNIDYSIYLVTDQKLIKNTSLYQAVEQAILGGCTIVQLREKDLSTFDFYQLATQIRQLTNQYQIPLIINDRIDIALAVKADGVHIGQSDMPVNVARRMIGTDLILGVSVDSKQQAQQAALEGADYLGVGAIFPTKTKNDAQTVSMQQLQQIQELVELPIVVIGGINQENAIQFKNQKIDGLAVVSAILAQDDIREATSQLKRIFTNK